MLDTRKYSIRFYVMSGIGSGIILSLALGMTYVFWEFGVEEKIFANHMTTSVFFTETLSSVGAATPWALISINWLMCKMGIKKWRSYSKKKFKRA